MPSLSDLEAFAQIARRIVAGDVSLRTIASEIGSSPSRVTQLIGRLERYYERDLLVRERNKAPSGLTSAGEQLLERVAALREPIVPPAINLVVSRTLITGDVLAPTLLAFRNAIPEGRVQLRFGIDRDFEQLVADLKTGKLDILLFWATPARMQQRPGGIRSVVLTDAVDLVVISHARSIVDQVDEAVSAAGTDRNAVSLDALSDRVLAALPPHAQIGNERLPHSVINSGVNRIEVGAFDEAKALVRSQCADYAIVPAVYPDLERDRSVGALQFSRPIGNASLVAFVRPLAAESLTNRLLGMIARDLNGHPRFVASNPQTVLGMAKHIPQEPEFYTRFRHGYYIGVSAPGRIEGDGSPLRWCHERMSLSVDGNRLTGRIENEFADTFDVSASMVGEILVLNAVSGGPSRPGRSFASVFTTLFETSHRQVLCGTWSGRDQSGLSGVFGTVCSDRELEPRWLEKYSRAASAWSRLHMDCEPRESHAGREVAESYET